jgi:hypothetical protein
VPRQRQVCYPEDVLGAVTAALDPNDPWFHCACCELPTPRRRPGRVGWGWRRFRSPRPGGTRLTLEIVLISGRFVLPMETRKLRRPGRTVTSEQPDILVVGSVISHSQNPNARLELPCRCGASGLVTENPWVHAPCAPNLFLCTVLSEKWQIEF